MLYQCVLFPFKSIVVGHKDEFSIGGFRIESLLRPFTGIIVHLNHSTSDETEQYNKNILLN